MLRVVPNKALDKVFRTVLVGLDRVRKGPLPSKTTTVRVHSSVGRAADS